MPVGPDAARPVGQSDAAPRPTPPPGAVVRRGCTKRCPACGGGHLFDGYFRLRDRCPRCGLHLHRHEGQMTGDIGINTIVTFTLLFAVLLGWTLLSGGHPNVTGLVIAGLAIAVVFPLLFFPFSKTIWLALDVAMNPLEASDFATQAGGSGASAANEDADPPDRAR